MGTNEEGEPIRDYMSILNPVLLDTLAGVTEEEKLRIVILYILNQNGISEEKLNKLLQHGNIEIPF
jgi:syntaxin-binding protein 1